MGLNTQVFAGPELDKKGKPSDPNKAAKSDQRRRLFEQTLDDAAMSGQPIDDETIRRAYLNSVSYGMAPKDARALEWALGNPEDPDAQAILSEVME